MIVVALGANLPGRFETPEKALSAAKAELQKRGVKIVKSSRVFKTAPVPVSDQPWYSNAVVAVETAQSPQDLIKTLQSIERDMGRVRTERNAPRIIDLDLIAYNDAVINETGLIVPHPRMNERAFVLLPLRDIAPDWPHLNDLVARLPRDQIAKPQWFTDKDFHIMGILNVTPDSFSDGGRHFANPVAHGLRMIAEGADIIDIGGESTRPNAVKLSVEEEQTRVLPAINGLKHHFLSIDTRNASTMQAAISAGARMINDVTALTHDPGAMAVAAAFDGPVCLMHMQGTPETMQKNPVYADVVGEIYEYLSNRIDACVKAGIDKGRIVIDPGFGFGKTFAHNMALVENFARFTQLGVPVLAGVSRKRFIGELMNNLPADQRLEGSLRIAKQLVDQGARIVRVHDVAQTVSYLRQSVL